MTTVLTDPPMQEPVRKRTQSLQRLVLSVRQFLELTRSVQQTYFVERDRLGPVDELEFERDWNAFYGRAADLQELLEGAVANLQHEKHTVSAFANLLGEQSAHYQSWFKRLSRTTAFARMGALLEELLPHERPVLTLHPKLCCSAPVLAALATLLERKTHK